MAALEFRLNRFERIVFNAAITLAGIVVLVRLGAMIVFGLLQHVH